MGGLTIPCPEDTFITVMLEIDFVHGACSSFTPAHQVFSTVSFGLLSCHASTTITPAGYEIGTTYLFFWLSPTYTARNPFGAAEVDLLLVEAAAVTERPRIFFAPNRLLTKAIF
ncbi:hypothetical protein F2Q69_00000745 [Brassica cretica]|uniref:Uncharacterized protein n=1 Tax=Brassica cretica TaxID=69181 RepID=A0A8S9NYV1_BRACR|nr:hypothetical protein F2Q69_00000745 [Brassica cretica]